MCLNDIENNNSNRNLLAVKAMARMVKWSKVFRLHGSLNNVAKEEKELLKNP